MERVTGIGGFFFRARDPDALKLWYQERLGVTTVPESYGERPWRPQLRAAGETVEVDPEPDPIGRFAALRDPEGNGIQLWQPE